jgi:hypothetical protein
VTAQCVGYCLSYDTAPIVNLPTIGDTLGALESLLDNGNQVAPRPAQPKPAAKKPDKPMSFACAVAFGAEGAGQVFITVGSAVILRSYLAGTFAPEVAGGGALTLAIGGVSAGAGWIGGKLAGCG